MLRGTEGEFKYLSPDQRGLLYEAFLARPGEQAIDLLPEAQAARYLTLPKLASRIGDLARQWTADATTDIEKAQRIEAHLKADYSYDLGTPSGAAPDPLDHFLFESHRGHCEFFSTAMAVMLRNVRVPSRNVTGFVGGTYNRFGNYYSVRQGDAHSWVEAYVRGRGWTRFDPTPPGGAQSLMPTSGVLATLRDMLEAVGKTWDRRVVRYDLQQQMSIFGGVRSRMRVVQTTLSGATLRLPGSRGPLAIGLVVVAAALFGTGLVFVWRRRGKPGPGASKRTETRDDRQIREATALYEALQRAMAEVGIPRGPGTPPSAHAQRLTAIGHPLAQTVGTVTERYVRARFGNEPLQEDERATLQRQIRSMRQALAQEKRLAKITARAVK